MELAHLHGGEVVYQPGDRLGPRTLQDFELVYMIEGHAAYECDGTSYSVEPGMFILARPGFSEIYRWDTEHPTRHAYFHFGLHCIPADWPDPKGWPCVFNDPDPLCAGLFRHVLQHVYEHDDWPAVNPAPSDSRLVAALIGTLIEKPHIRSASFERERPEPVRRALMHIHRLAEKDPHTALTLAELAGQANVTEKHLCRLFAKWVGHSPMQTYTLLKLDFSLSLLARTNLDVKEISQRSGFADPLYFSRIFSRAYGRSPTALRSAIAKECFRPCNLLPVDLFPRIRW